MPAKQRPRIVVTNAKAKKSAVAELVLQQLRTYGVIADPSDGAAGEMDLLVTTGAEFSATTVSHTELLILDASEANKKALLSETGLCTSGDAWAYFIGKSGPRGFRIIELPKDDSVDVHDGTITPAHKGQPLPPELRERLPETTVTFSQPDLAVADLASAIFDYRAEEGGAVALQAADPVIPPGVKYWKDSLTVVTKGAINNFGKTQNPTISITYDVWAFLNNPPVGPQYQYIYILQKGVVNPGDLMDYSTYYKGYGQFQVETTIEPSSNLENIVFDASSPPNVNDKRVIDSSVGFTVNYSENSGGGAQFDYRQSISQEISDWQIIEQTRLAKTRWTFAQRYPFNWLARICGADSGDTAPFDYWDRVKDFPNLTRYTLQPQTQSVWRTTKVLNEQVQFNSSVVQSLNYYWYRFLWFECPGANVGASRSITVDLSKVSG